MARSKKKRVKVKKIKHNLKDKRTNKKIKGRGYDGDTTAVVTNTKKKKQTNTKQAEVKKPTKKSKK